MYEVSIAVAVLLSVIHHMADHLAGHVEKYKSKLSSFNAGLFLSIIFLLFLPEITIRNPNPSMWIFEIILLGFIAFRFAEKYIYIHIPDRKMRTRDLDELHVVSFFADSFVIGFSLVFFEIVGYTSTLNSIVILPFFLHTIAATLSIHVLVKGLKLGHLAKLGLSSSTIIGALAGIAIGSTALTSLFYPIFAFITGVLIYIVVRELTPPEVRGTPGFLALGVLVGILSLDVLRNLFTV
ncbi:MAG: hypothetical protein J4432_05165 [DPANN group archaeon]|nr:hypothetical protein [DPANN group archaeon]